MEIDNGKEYNEAVKTHATVVETMEGVGYRLLKDGKTFYRRGLELAPKDCITFSMREAYEIHRFLTTAMQRAYEAGREEEKSRIWKMIDDTCRGKVYKNGKITPPDNNK